METNISLLEKFNKSIQHFDEYQFGYFCFAIFLMIREDFFFKFFKRGDSFVKFLTSKPFTINKIFSNRLESAFFIKNMPKGRGKLKFQ